MKTFTLLAGSCLALSLFFFSLPTHLNAQNIAKRITASNGDSVPFLEYKPAGHNAPGNTRKYPLIIFLHGGGERNDNPSIAAGAPVWNLQGSGSSSGAFNGFGPSRLVRLGHKMAFTWNGQVDSIIVISPMSRLTKRTAPNQGSQINVWPLEYVEGIINYARDSLKVDTNRIYLTGLSYGGGGTFNYLNSSLANVQKLAAAAPVCAWLTGLNSNGQSYVANAKLPLWGFHAIDDPTSNGSYTVTQNSINGVNALNPQVKALFTLMPDGQHYIWPRVYNIDSAAYAYGYEGIINIYEWFLGQNKSLAVNSLPVANVGNDITISTTTGTATLSGGASTDADGTIVRYVWKKIGAAAGTIATPLGAASSTTISGLTTPGVYKYELIVVDNRAAIARDTLTITVVNTASKAVTISSSGRITTGDVTQLNNASKFTLEAQFKYDATVSSWTTIMRKGISLNDRIMLHIGPSNNSIYVMVGNGSNTYGYTGANAVSPGTWYHVAAVFDGTQTGDANRLKLYINGVQQTLSFSGTIPATTSSINTAPFMAGGEPSCCYLNGTIDEVRVWNTALSAGTITAWKDKLLGSCHPDIANLVVYWPLNNDANPATATAELGTAYTGSITNGAYVVSSQATDTTGCSPGKAVTMSSLGRITTGDVTQLNNASKFTLEAQFRYDATVSGWTTIMRKATSLTDRIMLHIGPNNNSIYVMVGNGANSYGYTAANAVSPGNWYHVAAVFDGTQTGDANRLKLYIDGVQQTLSFSATSIPATTSSINTAPFMAGGEPACCYLNGTVDEVRVWNTALSAATINAWKDKLLRSCHPAIANLVVYWPLDNNSNPAVATAELGTAYTGTITNGSYAGSNQATDTSGCNAMAVAISPSSGKITTGDVVQLKSASKFTLEAQFKYDATLSSYTTIIRKSTSLTDRIMVHIGPNNNSIHLVVANGSNSYGITGANAVSPGTWYHIAAVFDGTQTGDANRLKLYIDGVQQTLSFSATPIPASTSSTNAASFIAGGEPSCCYLNGTIDEVRVWNTALSSSTITAWKDKLLGSCHPNITNLVLYWPLNDNAVPTQATAELGTAYTGTITDGAYVSSSQATASSNCGARVAQLPSSEEVKENKPFTGRIYPNPTEGLIQIELNAPDLKLVTINVANMSGRHVYKNKSPLVKGNNKISLNIASFPPGIYIIEIGDGKTIMEKYKVLKR